MSKTAPEKTNGHTVDAIPVVAQKAAARPLQKGPAKPDAKPAAKAAAKAPVKAPVKAAVKAAAKGPAKPAVKAPARPAAKVAAKPAAKPAVKAAPAKPAAKLAAKGPVKPAAPKAPAKAAAKAAPKAVKAPKSAAKSGAAPAEREKTRKPKLVRDSFTMPEEEYAVLALVKKACLKAGFEIKKSELLRVGVALISQIDVATLKSVLASLPQLKTGRPKSS